MTNNNKPTSYEDLIARLEKAIREGDAKIAQNLMQRFDEIISRRDKVQLFSLGWNQVVSSKWNKNSPNVEIVKMIGDSLHTETKRKYEANMPEVDNSKQKTPRRSTL